MQSPDHLEKLFERRGFVAVLQSRMSYFRDYFQRSEKSQLKLCLLEFCGTVSWFHFSMHKPKKLMETGAMSCQCPVHFLPKRNFVFADIGFFIFTWMFILQVLPTDSGLQMAKSSSISDYEIKCTPSGKARVLFKFCFLMGEVKKDLMSHYIYVREICV